MANPVYIAVGLAILGLVILIGLSIFVAFLFWKVYSHHKSINRISEKTDRYIFNTNKRLAKQEEKLSSLSFLVKKYGLDDEVVYRHIQNNDNGNSSSHHEHPDSHSINPAARPSVVVKIDRDIANIFGHAPPDTQVIGIVQSQYKQKTKNVVGVDDMEFKSEGCSRQYMSGTTKRKTIYEGRPTSVLFDNATMTPTTGPSQKGIFVHKTIGKDGGILSVFGMKLAIPSGALNKDTQITLGATWDTEVYPNLTKPNALLSPVLVCQPSIQFSKHVILTFPHCAEEIQDWKFQMLQRANDLQDKSNEWKELQINDNANLEISAYKVTLKVDHFTLFNLTGQSSTDTVAKKAVKLLAFTTPFQNDRFFKVLIYCINNYDRESSELQSIQEEATSYDMKKADVMQPMILQDNNEDIIVTLRNVSIKWTLDGEKSQSIDFESAWHSLSPSCKFVFNPADDSVRKIICDFIYNQKPSKKFRSIKIAEEHIQFSPLALKDKLGQTRKLMQKLILLMDPQSDNDWRVLAEKIGYTHDKIRWLETQLSPTEIVLNKLKDDGKLISDLKGPLSQMGRLDAVSEIEEAERDSNRSSHA